MGELFAEVFAFVAGAFLLGLFVGFLFWRWRRISMGGEEWRTVSSEVERLRRHVAELSTRPVALPVGSGAAGGPAADVEAGADRDTARTALHGRNGSWPASATGPRAWPPGWRGPRPRWRFSQRRLTELAVADTSSPVPARPPQPAALRPAPCRQAPSRPRTATDPYVRHDAGLNRRVADGAR